MVEGGGEQAERRGAELHQGGVEAQQGEAVAAANSALDGERPQTRATCRVKNSLDKKYFTQSTQKIQLVFFCVLGGSLASLCENFFLETESQRKLHLPRRPSREDLPAPLEWMDRHR